MATGISRFGKHLMPNRWRVRQAFPEDALKRIEEAIKQSETQHAGQIRFAVEAALDGRPLLLGQSARARAIDLFSHLRVWDTEHNSGVLIYLLFADRDVEIVADRGINTKIGAQRWQEICSIMETEFRKGHFEAGVLRGIELITAHLAEHFPPKGSGRNELPDTPLII
jgi:uncharacterized membrane protein